jgi:hypothetical protein
MVVELTAEEVAARRKRVRATTVRLVLFAVAVYIGYIIAFMNRK